MVPPNPGVANWQEEDNSRPFCNFCATLVDPGRCYYWHSIWPPLAVTHCWSAKCPAGIMVGTVTPDTPFADTHTPYTVTPLTGYFHSY